MRILNGVSIERQPTSDAFSLFRVPLLVARSVVIDYSPVSAWAFLVCILLLVSLPLSGEITELYVERPDENHLRLSIKAEIDADILKYITSGMTTEIWFEIRVYKIYAKLFRGPLQLRRTISTTGRMDLFNDRYALIQGDSVTRFVDEDIFLMLFFSSGDWIIPVTLEEGRNYKIMARYRIIPMNLAPPLNLLTQTTHFSTWSAWYSRNIEEEPK